MRRSDKIDVNAAEALQFKHGLSQLLDCHLAAVPVVADVIVLTKDTAQVTTCKENRTRTSPADKHALFSEMRTYGTDYWFITDAAEADFAFDAIYFTFTWT